MSRLQRNISLQPYNTFGISATAKWWLAVANEQMALEFILDNINAQWLTLIVGGGSNMLLTRNPKGVVLHNQIMGKEVIAEDDDYVFLKIGAGENWHALVLHCLERNWGGIENLSLIPGLVGAAPIQNIGAYGVELTDVFVSLEAIHLQTGARRVFSKADCAFGYRDSIFKHQLRGQYLITRVILRLSRHPVLRTDYGAIREALATYDGEIGIREVSEVVCQIRRSKLPDPKEIGNAGSFFKNPEVSPQVFAGIANRYPDLPHYPLDNGKIKIPAAWLIETCGWKGKKFGNYGVHERQALVLVNYGGATGREIFELSTRIMESVEEKFGIVLEREVNII